MSANRRRHENVVPVAALVTFALVASFVLVAGIGYVSLKNQLHTGADEIKNLEREIEQVGMRMTVVKSEIQKLTSMDALKRRYEGDKGRLGGLVEIPPDRIQWVDRPLPGAGAEQSDLQTTSNPNPKR